MPSWPPRIICLLDCCAKQDAGQDGVCSVQWGSSYVLVMWRSVTSTIHNILFEQKLKGKKGKERNSSTLCKLILQIQFMHIAERFLSPNDARKEPPSTSYCPLVDDCAISHSQPLKTLGFQLLFSRNASVQNFKSQPLSSRSKTKPHTTLCHMPFCRRNIETSKQCIVWK